MVPPSKEKCPNFKADEFFCWLQHIWKETWVLGEGFSINEQTTKCQGKCEYKTRCGKFKRIGDGLQADCIADNGYTWDFFSATSQLTRTSSQRAIAPCTAGCCTCFSTCVSLVTSARWTTCLTL